MLLAIPCVHRVNSLGQVPVFSYRIIGQHRGPSLSPLLLPRERWKPYWSCVWISDQSPQISPQGRARENRWQRISIWLRMEASWRRSGRRMWRSRLAALRVTWSGAAPRLSRWRRWRRSLLRSPGIELNKWLRFQWRLPQPSALCLARATADLINF